MFLDLPQHVFCGAAQLNFVSVCTFFSMGQLLGTWFFPCNDLCDADDPVQDEQHVLFYCTDPHVVSLRTKSAFLCPQTGTPEVSVFLQRNKLYFFLHQLIAFYEQASSRTF